MAIQSLLTKKLRGLFFVFLILGPAGERKATADDPAKIAVTVRQQSGWTVAETPSFCCCVKQEATARNLATACEQWKQRLAQTWGPTTGIQAWSPRCEIVVHASLAEYRSTLGRPGDASVGSTRLQFDGERVVLRRIDLRCDAADWCVAALPHELTHVVLAEEFHNRPLPPWADEGIAMLSEVPHKQQQRMADLRRTLQHRSTYRIADLLAVRQLPPAHLRDAYYGQSLALTSWMVERATPQGFARFLQACDVMPFDEAIQKELGLKSVADLEREWRQWVHSPQSHHLVSLSPPLAAQATLAFARDE
ncbi:MAG: hypothetical protein SH850_02950 [Planctomycetaceae bacterium]|nr:hypothetical protein [Planctomycetaceae bacterium]